MQKLWIVSSKVSQMIQYILVVCLRGTNRNISGSSTHLLSGMNAIACINTSTTKEIVINFQRKTPQITPVNIEGLDIETVRTHIYLGVHLNNKLDYTDNTDALYKESQVAFSC